MNVTHKNNSHNPDSVRPKDLLDIGFSKEPFSDIWIMFITTCI